MEKFDIDRFENWINNKFPLLKIDWYGERVIAVRYDQKYLFGRLIYFTCQNGCHYFVGCEEFKAKD